MASQTKERGAPQEISSIQLKVEITLLYVRPSAVAPSKTFTVPVKADGSVTIQDFKAAIHLLQGIPPADQALLCAGKWLEDEKTLAGYKIGEGSIINMFLHTLHADLKVNVKTLTRKLIIITLKPDGSDDIKTLKQKIQDKEGIPPEQMRLVFSGEQLEDDRTLASYGIVHESIVYMRLTLRGCGCGCGRNVEVEVESEEAGLESDEGEGMAGMEQREQLNEILDQPGWGFDEVRGTPDDEQLLGIDDDDEDGSSTVAYEYRQDYIDMLFTTPS